jgi:hypothetical protein
MRASGTTTRQRARALSGMQREMFMKVNLRMTKLTAMAYTPMSMVPNTKATGKMICKKGMAVRFGVMGLSILALTKKAKSTTMGFIYG